MEKKIFTKGTLNEQTYEVRMKNYDKTFAEQRFEQYCKEKNYHFKELKLNSKEIFNSPIPHWTKLGLLTAQPDYFVYNDEKQLFVELKASNKIKLKDLKKYCAWETVFCDIKYTPYYLVFCLNDKIVFKTINQILELLHKSSLQSYHEGNKYWVIPI